MVDDIDDIYGDLPNFELDKECERLQNELEDLKLKTDEFSNKINELTKEKEKLEKTKLILVKNISILLKTARQEIQRKDAIILQLRNELETLKSGKSNFHRYNTTNKSESKILATPVENDKTSSNKDKPISSIANKNVKERLGPLQNNKETLHEPLDTKLLKDAEKSAEDRLKVENRQQVNNTDSKSTRQKLNRDVLDQGVEYHNRNVSKSCNDTDDRGNYKSSRNTDSSRDRDMDRDRFSSRDSKSYKDDNKRSQRRFNENNKPKDRGDSNSWRDKPDRLSHDSDNYKGSDVNDGRRERLGSEFDSYRNVDRYGVRSDSRYHRHADRRFLDNNVRGKRKHYEDDLNDKTYRSSSPPRHSGSRSPNRKRRRSPGLKEAIATSPPHKFPRENNPGSTQLAKTEFENSLKTKETEQRLDDRKTQNIENLRNSEELIIPPFVESHNKSEGKEEGEMSDSDSYKDAEEDHPVQEWKPLIRKKREEAPKTIFTLRMEQKLKREDEERKRAMIHAAANDQNNVDTTLFDKPIKIKRNDNPSIKNTKKIFEPNKEQNSSIPSLPDSNLEKPEIKSLKLVKPPLDNRTENLTVNVPPLQDTKADKSKLKLNISKDNPHNIAMELVKQSSVETYSPFKENYKLIELSPAVLAKSNSYHKNLEINKNDQVIQIDENKKNLSTASESSSISINVDQSEKESTVEVPEVETKFDVQKPLKPLLPTDIFGAILESEPSALLNENQSSSQELKKCETSLNNETKKVVDSCQSNTVSKSLQSYRIPKKSSIKKSDDELNTKERSVIDNKDANRDIVANKSLKQDSKKSTKDSRSEKVNNSAHRTKEKLSSDQLKKETTDRSKIKNTKIEKLTSEKTEDPAEKHNVGSSDDNSKKIGNTSKEKKAVKIDKVPLKSNTTKTVPSKVEKEIVKIVRDDAILKTDKTENNPDKSKSSKHITTRRSSKDKPTKDKTEKSVKEATVPEKLRSDNDGSEKSISPTNQTCSKVNEINNCILTPRNISINPIITVDTLNAADETIEKPELSTIIKQKDNTNKKKEELMSGLNLDATPLNLLDSSVVEENRIQSPCPITPDIPRELLRPAQVRNNCPTESDFQNFTEKQTENKSSNDIANFEIFKSVNINNSSSSMDNSHESKTSNRLQNDLCLSETEPDSENSSCEDSDSEASDIMEMFD